MENAPPIRNQAACVLKPWQAENRKRKLSFSIKLLWTGELILLFLTNNLRRLSLTRDLSHLKTSITFSPSFHFPILIGPQNFVIAASPASLYPWQNSQDWGLYYKGCNLEEQLSDEMSSPAADEVRTTVMEESENLGARPRASITWQSDLEYVFLISVAYTAK